MKGNVGELGPEREVWYADLTAMSKIVAYGIKERQ
jgi:hypothetical protein